MGWDGRLTGNRLYASGRLFFCYACGSEKSVLTKFSFRFNEDVEHWLKAPGGGHPYGIVFKVMARFL